MAVSIDRSVEAATVMHVTKGQIEAHSQHFLGGGEAQSKCIMYLAMAMAMGLRIGPAADSLLQVRHMNHVGKTIS